MRRRASAPKRVRRALARDGDHDARLAPLERLPRGGGLTCERRGLRAGDVLCGRALPDQYLVHAAEALANGEVG
jgi:hypothetical protein